MLVLVKNQLKFTLAQDICLKKHEIEVFALDIEGTLFLSVYIRHGSTVAGIKDLLSLYQDAEMVYDNIIIIGDLNARSRLAWQEQNNNIAGRCLDKFLLKEGCNLHLLNNEDYTFERPNFGRCVIDLCLVSTAVCEYVSDF